LSYFIKFIDLFGIKEFNKILKKLRINLKKLLLLFFRLQPDAATILTDVTKDIIILVDFEEKILKEKIPELHLNYVLHRLICLFNLIMVKISKKQI